MKALDIIAALAGTGGTAFLYWGTFDLVGLTGVGMYTNKLVQAEVAEENRRRMIKQRIGFGLLMVSFFCSLLHVLIE